MFRAVLKLVIAFIVAGWAFPSTAQPTLALVIDDLGYSQKSANAAFSLPGNHTFAIIPDSSYSFWTALTAQDQQRETILHLPMQSSHNHVAAEPNALNQDMPEQEYIAQVLNYLQQLPGISGVNNHMGSLLTQQRYLMRPLMDTIHQQNPDLVFLDSRTSPNSQAYQAAIEAGLNATRRDIFLDHVAEEAIIREQFKLWLQRSRQSGHALAIAHPHPVSLEVLQELIPEAEKQGFRFVTLSTYVAELQSDTPWPRYLSHLQTDSKNSKPLP